jgi:hypothetical protein
MNLKLCKLLNMNEIKAKLQITASFLKKIKKSIYQIKSKIGVCAAGAKEGNDGNRKL